MTCTAFPALTKFFLVIGEGPSKLIVVAPSQNCHRRIVHIFSRRIGQLQIDSPPRDRVTISGNYLVVPVHC